MKILSQMRARTRNKKYHVAIVFLLLIVCLVVIGIFLFGGGNSKPISGKPTKAEIAAQEKVIRNYYGDINEKDYKAAYELTSTNFQKGMSYANFRFEYKTYISSVKIESMTRMYKYSAKNNGVFNVTFNAIYRQKYPYFKGELPTVHVVQREKEKSNNWKLDSIGVGLSG